MPLSVPKEVTSSILIIDAIRSWRALWKEVKVNEKLVAEADRLTYTVSEWLIAAVRKQIYESLQKTVVKHLENTKKPPL